MENGGRTCSDLEGSAVEQNRGCPETFPLSFGKRIRIETVNNGIFLERCTGAREFFYFA